MALCKGGFETVGMSKRGPYVRSKPKTPPPRWRKTFLAQWRMARGMTQEDLSEQSGVSVGNISAMEAGNSGYSAESLHKLAEALGIEPGMILSVNPEGQEPLWAMMRRASAEEIQQIEKHAAVIVGSRPTRKK